MTNRIILTVCFCVALWGLAACQQSPEKQAPQVLRIGVLPDESIEKLETRFQGLIAYLQDELGIECQLIIPETYEQLVTLFVEDKIDLARFGGFTFLTASHATKAITLVSRKRDLEFSSYFLVQSDNPATGLQELKGQRLTFGSKQSTSGHLMPRHFLKGMEIEPESFFKAVQFSGAHDATAYQVSNATADVGVANALVIDAMFRDGRLSRKQVRILWETPPYPDYTWATRASINMNLRDAIRNAFLQLSDQDPTQINILNALDANYYLPVESSMFNDLESIAINLGLLQDRRP